MLRSRIARPARKTKNERRRRRFARLGVEQLEDRTLLSATILGSVWNDIVPDGARAANEPGLAAATVYLDLNHNGSFDSTVSQFSQNAPTLTPSTLLSPTDLLSTVNVSGLQTPISKVTVTLDVTNTDDPATGDTAIEVDLVSPEYGPNSPVGAILMFLNPGDHFSGTIDEQASTPITLAGPPYPTGGTFQPAGSFSAPNANVYNGLGPNGQWGLLFRDQTTSGSTVSIQLNSFSLTFTDPEPSATTDANGNYSFSGLNAATYTVGVVPTSGATVTFPGGGMTTQDVTVAANQTAANVNFGVHAAPDLVGTSFQVTPTPATWGSSVTVNYTITNQGQGAAAPFTAGIYLSNTGTISTSGPLEQTIQFDKGLNAGDSITGSTTFTLPASPPAGFAGLPSDLVYLGFVIDPTNAVAESNEANNSNQGIGVDLAPLAQLPNQDVTSAEPALQQMPSVAVDPHDSSHVVTAYMDYSLLNTGYAGIGIANSTDYGSHWTYKSIPLPVNFNEAAGQPVARFDDQGHVYVAFMAATFFGPKPGLIYDTSLSGAIQKRSFGFQANNGIFVAESDDGLTWDPSKVVAVSEQRYDQTLTTSALGVSAGPATVQPGVMDPNIVANSKLIIDQGLANQETVIVTSVTATTFTATFTQSHAAGFTIHTPVVFDAIPDMAIDTNPSSPFYENVDVTWTRFYPRALFAGKVGLLSATGGTDIMLAVSIDHGQSFQTRLDGGITTIRDPLVGFSSSGSEGSGRSTLSRISIGPGGDIYISMFAGGRFPVFHSTDAGMTFNSPNPFLPYGYPFANDLFYPPDTPAAGEFPVPGTTLFNDNFRTLAVRDIVADPTHPGVLYAVEAISITTLDGNTIDKGEINFARSSDFGQTWESIYTVGSNIPNTSDAPGTDLERFRPSLNDDDGSRLLIWDTPQQLVNEVISGQAIPQMSVDTNGNIVVVWYDTRRDPANGKLDVFGTTSTDGGHTFSANFAITNAPFDPNAGSFTDAAGGQNYFLGDHLGLALANGVAYVAWTGVNSSGAQNIYFQRFNEVPVQPPLNDRFEPNDTPAMATDLGQVLAQQVVPRLTLTGDDNDWFRVQAGATGDLIVSATAPASGGDLQLELWDADINGNIIGTSPLTLGTGISDTGSAGEQISYNSTSGHFYFIHVFAIGNSTVQTYSLTLQSLTADLGTTVQTSVSNSIAVGGQAAYRVVAAVSGTLQLTLTSQTGASGDLVLQALTADGQTVLATGQTSGGPGAGEVNTINLSVEQGQVILIVVSGTTGSFGDFSLDLINLDQYETGSVSSVFLPLPGNPSGIAAADLIGDNRDDLVVTSDAGSNPVDVILSNADGTFQAARQFAVGAGLSTSAVRPPVVADLNNDGIPDLIIPNYSGADVSVLIGNGDGTYQPERRYDTSSQPDSVVVGNFDGRKDAHGNPILDLAVVGRTPNSTTLSILFNRGDGTFLPPVNTTITSLPRNDAFPILAGNLTGNGMDDLVIFGGNDAAFQVLLSNGDGTFRDGGTYSAGETTNIAVLADVRGNGTFDIISGGANSGSVFYIQNNGDGTFQTPIPFSTGQLRAGDNVGVVGLAVADFGSSTEIGTADGHQDVLVTTESRLGTDPPRLLMLPGQVDGLNNFTGFGTPVQLAVLQKAGQVAVGDFNGDSSKDVATTDSGGVRVVYGTPPVIAANNTQATARNLGVVVHSVSAPQAIVSGHEDAFFQVTVPTEAVSGAGDEVVDFSALFADVQGTGLNMEVYTLDGMGSKVVLGTGDRLRLDAAQGEQLFVHVFGMPAHKKVMQGVGVYTLDIDVLPQVVSVTAPPILPGGPTNSLVITLQGDRLDPSTAEDAKNYTVTWAGSDGIFGTADDQVMTIATATGSQPVIYSPGTNVDTAAGYAVGTSGPPVFPTAVRQTVTLLFDQPLPEGSYTVELKAGIQADPYNSGETALLPPLAGFTDHALVSISGKVMEGVTFEADNVVAPVTSGNDLNSLNAGSSFLSQLHDDLGAQLDSQLNQTAGNGTISAALLNQILNKFVPVRGDTSYLILWFDPVSIDLADPRGDRAVYDLKSNQVNNNLARTFIEVGGNIEVMVLAGVQGTYTVNLSDVQQNSRAGAVLLGNSNTAVALTDALQGGIHSFSFDFGEASTASSSISVTNQLASLNFATVQEANALTASNAAAAANEEIVVAESGESIALGSEATFISATIGFDSVHLGSGVDVKETVEITTADRVITIAVEVFERWPKFLSDAADAMQSKAAFDAAMQQMPAEIKDLEKTLSTIATATLDQVAKTMDSAMRVAGKNTLVIPDLGIKGLANDLVDIVFQSGKAAAKSLATQLRTQTKVGPVELNPPGSTTPQTGTPGTGQQGPMAPMTPAPLPPEEESSLWRPEDLDKRDQIASLDSASNPLSALCLSAFFASGIWMGGVSRSRSEKEDRRKISWDSMDF
jgi:hypothetical protein